MELTAKLRQINRLQNRAVGVETLGDFDDMIRQWLVLDNRKRKKIRSILFSDSEQITETFRHNQAVRIGGLLS